MNSLRNLFTAFNPLSGFLNNISSWAGQFKQFATNPIQAVMGMQNVRIPKDFHGTPEDMVKYLISTGQMSQQDFEQYGQAANQLQNMLPKF